MEPRKQQLLQLVVEKYIETAEPIGSKFLVEDAGLDISGATVRNELRDLEAAGYLTHPHTSAGRIPTELGYRYYIDELLSPKAPKQEIQREIQEIGKAEEDVVRRTKAFAKFTAQYVENAVIVALGKETVYYSGLSSLFAQPEFQNVAYTISMSQVFDHCEDRIEEVREQLKDSGVTVLIGKENPLGRDCGMVGIKVGDTVFTILGPMRMDYNKAIGLLEFIYS